jgi:hypothetical protein
MSRIASGKSCQYPYTSRARGVSGKTPFATASLYCASTSPSFATTPVGESVELEPAAVSQCRFQGLHRKRLFIHRAFLWYSHLAVFLAARDPFARSSTGGNGPIFAPSTPVMPDGSEDQSSTSALPRLALELRCRRDASEQRVFGCSTWPHTLVELVGMERWKSARRKAELRRVL